MWSKPFKLRTSNLFGIQLLKFFQHWPCFLWDLDTTQHLCIPPVVPNRTFRNSHDVFIPSKTVVNCEETPILKLVQKPLSLPLAKGFGELFQLLQVARWQKKKTGLPSKSIVHIFIPKMPICFEQKNDKNKKHVYTFSTFLDIVPYLTSLKLYLETSQNLTNNHHWSPYPAAACQAHNHGQLGPDFWMCQSLSKQERYSKFIIRETSRVHFQSL